MNQGSSKASMPRSAVETLKQIQQKQGISISIVQPDSSRQAPLDSSVSKELRPKANVTIEKNPKLPTRTLVTTEGKAVLSQTKSGLNIPLESRLPGGQVSSISFQEAKAPAAANKSLSPVSSASETRAFGSQSWSNPSPSAAEGKIQNRIVQSVVMPDSKSQSGISRVVQGQSAFNESKSVTPRGVANVTDNKTTPNRVFQVSNESKTQARPQLTFEGKVPSRVSVSVTPQEKIFSPNTNRSNQNILLQDSKVVLEQRTIPSNSQSKPSHNNRVADVKATSSPLRVTQTMKNMQKEKVIAVEQGLSPLQQNLIANSAFRVASALGDKTPEEKALLKVTRVSQNMVSITKNQAAIQAKTTQSMTMLSEGKALNRVVKDSSVTSDQFLKPTSLDSSSDAPTTPITSMAPTRGIQKRPQGLRTILSPAKKKCAKRSPNNIIQDGKLQADDPNKELGTPKKIEIQGITRGLTITPVSGNSTSTSTPGTSGSNKKYTESPSTNNIPLVVCPSCGQCSENVNFCVACQCKIPANSQRFVKKVMRQPIPSFVVTKNVTTSIEKKIVYQFPPDMVGQNQSFHFQQAMQGKVMFESSTNIPVSPRGKGRPKSRRKFVEPVCYTLSSDEEEPVSMPYNSVLDESMNASNVYPMESEGSKSDRSSTSDVIPDENLEYDDPQFPGVTDINPRIAIEEEEEEEEEPEEEEADEEGMDFEGEDPEQERDPGFDEEVEDEEMPVDEEEEEERQRLLLLQQKAVEGKSPTDYPIKCRSIRIGSYKVHPHVTMGCLPVVLKEDSIAFQVPIVSQPNKNVWIQMKSNDIQQAIVHFGRCLPIMFVFTSPSFGESVRKGLHMVSKEHAYFDPTSQDDKIKKITFLIESVEDPQKEFIRHVFPGDKKIREVDQKMANEILVRSTPKAAHSQIVKLQAEPITVPVSVVVESQVTPPPSIPSQLSVTKVIVPQQPIVKLLTYPPPPQTGGIAITSEDLACLNEGEFLNDVIIDFYLKYIFFEKLSPSEREKTHIFSSFFYPRLTHKPDNRVRPGDEPGKTTVQARRHNQVKTWTRHVDIFSKDYIIIPVNQNVHWFLAIICYPGRVPETTSTPLPENKSPDNVTSTDEQENTNKLIIKEISSNGEGDSPNQDDNSTGSASSPYEVEEPPDSDELSSEAPDSSTHPDGKQRKEMPCICIFDSLSGPSRWRIAAHLREYLEMEWKSKKGSKKVFDRNTMQGFIMKCPQQTNYSDCGTYLLQFVESFFENPMPYFGTPMPDLTNWFSEEKISKKRLQLQELILQLQKKQQASVAANARKVNQTDRTHLSSPMQQTDNR